MVNDFGWEKVSTENRFHHQSMFTNAAVAVTVRVFAPHHKNVPVNVFYATTPPRWVVLHSLKEWSQWYRVLLQKL
jgi:hypothetical protein